MAIISEYEEQNAPSPPNAAAPPLSPVSFSASLDPSNPTDFLRKVFEFVASRTNYLEKPGLENEIAAIVRMSVEKRKLKEEAEAKAKTVEEGKQKAKAAEEIKQKAKEAENSKQKAEAAAAKKEEVNVPEVQMKDAEVDKKDGKRGMFLPHCLDLDV